MPVSSDPNVRVVFLGGVGEVGRNMACIELDGRILLVDVGLSFPSADMFGIDLVLPDFDYVRERADQIEAVVLTHGHEDHIGALPVPPARADRHARLRDGVHARAARGQARRARRRRSMRAPRGDAGRGNDDGRSVLDAVPARDALDPRRHGGRRRHAVRDASCTPATSRSIRRRWTGARPTCTAWPKRRAATASISSCPTRRTPRRPDTRRASGASARSCIASSRRRRTSSWWRASPATSIASSRW